MARGIHSTDSSITVIAAAITTCGTEAVRSAVRSRPAEASRPAGRSRAGGPTTATTTVAHFPIRNDDALYTLALDPASIAATLGARPFSAAELEAHWRFWRAVAERQHLRDIPATREDMRCWARDYERREFAPSTAGRAVADALAADFSARALPAGLRPFGREILSVISPANLRETHGLPGPRPAVRSAVRTVSRAYLDGVALRPVPLDRSLARTFGTRRAATGDPAAVGHRHEGR